MARTKKTAKASERSTVASKMPRSGAVALQPPKPPKRRARPGVKALREIKKAQKCADPILPFLPFMTRQRAITDEIIADRDNNVPSLESARYTKDALAALRDAYQSWIIDYLANSRRCAAHAKRVTVERKDLRLAARVIQHAAPQSVYSRVLPQE